MKTLFIMIFIFLAYSISASTTVETKPLVLDEKRIFKKASRAFRPIDKFEFTSKTPRYLRDKIALGKKLFFEKRLSSNNKMSCNTCHNLKTYGVDNQFTSLGVKGKRGGRNSPTVYNAFLHDTQFWDGREPDVEAQAIGPILNPVEMNMPNAAAVMEKIKNSRKLPKTF